MSRRYPIPTRRNLGYAALVPACMIGLLWGVGQLTSPLATGAAVAAFCLAGQALFALIHEAEHGHLLPDRRWNDWLGSALSALFPASFAVLRAGHLVHHRRNRTEAEMIDFYRPGESRIWITLKYYASLTGGIWLGALILSLLMVFLPLERFRLPGDHDHGSDLKTYLAFLTEASPWRIRGEVVFTVALWAGLTPLLGLGIEALVTYLIFGLVWSSQQFIWHVRTPLHLVEGSWNLHMWPVFQRLLLNANHHLTHHRHPNVPWNHLPGLTEEPPWRSYMATWANLARPPRPIDCAWPQVVLTRGPLPEPTPAEFLRPGRPEGAA